MKHSTKLPTVAQQAAFLKMRELGCIVCALVGDVRPRKIEAHHIVRGNKRMGHRFVLPLCLGHHRGKWNDQIVRVGIADGRKAFKEAHGYDELELWQKLQVTLGLDDTLPVSKIVARKNHAHSRLSEDVLDQCAHGPVESGAHHARPHLDGPLDALGEAALPAALGVENG